MKILAIFFLVVLLSSLAKSKDGRKPKTNLKAEFPDEEYRSRHHPKTPFPAHSSRRGFPMIREKPRIAYVDEGIREIPKIPHDDNENRGRRTRQSVITVQVPAGTQSGGNQNNGGFQLNSPFQVSEGLHSQTPNPGFQPGPPLQFQGSSAAGNHPGNPPSGIQQDTPLEFQGVNNHPGNQGGLGIAGGIVISSSGNHGGATFQPGIPGSLNDGFSSSSHQAVSHENLAAAGPGGLSSPPDSGLAGGLGGAFGGGYGFGLGGLIFGGPAGPVFAGNTALIENFGGNEDDGGGVDDNPVNQDDPQQTTLFQTVPPRGYFFDNNGREMTNTNANKQKNRGVPGNVYPKGPYHPGASKTTAQNAGTPNSGETIGYVAFIFPRRSSNRLNTQKKEYSKSAGKQKLTQEISRSRTKVSDKPIINRIATYFIPVPVHIPIDRPYPIPVPKAYPVQVLRPYPVAVPKPVPVPVPVAVSFAEPVPYVPKPVNAEVPVLVGNLAQHSGVNLFLQP